METREAIIKNKRVRMEETKISSSMGSEEFFQNTIIRPVVEFQENLLLEIFRNYIVKHKKVFYGLSVEKKLGYIENAVHKDTKFRNLLKGVVLGQFTVEEYLHYTKNSSALNKRIMIAVKEKLEANLQLFER